MLIGGGDLSKKLLEIPLARSGRYDDAITVESDLDVGVLGKLRLNRKRFGDANGEAVAPSLNACNHLTMRLT